LILSNILIVYSGNYVTVNYITIKWFGLVDSPHFVSQKQRRTTEAMVSAKEDTIADVEFKIGGGMEKTAHITTEDAEHRRDYDLSIPRNKCRMQLARALSALRAVPCYGLPTPARSYASPVIETAVIDCSPRESDAKP